MLLECHFRADQEARKIVFRDVHQFAATQTAVASRYVVETFGISERILTPRQQSQPITDSTGREMPAEFEPTADQRALVQNAAAFGINQADIANQLNIDEKTLRKHFRTTRKSGRQKLSPGASPLSSPTFSTPSTQSCPSRKRSRATGNRPTASPHSTGDDPMLLSARSGFVSLSIRGKLDGRSRVFGERCLSAPACRTALRRQCPGDVPLDVEKREAGE